MKKFKINLTLKCTKCQIVKPFCFAGLAQSHVDYFKKAQKDGVLPDWHCDHCGRAQDLEVLALEAIEEGR